MKIEFLVALTDHTWHTKIVDVPNVELPENVDDPMFDVQAERWACVFSYIFGDKIALISVYNSDPEDKDGD